MQQGGNCTRLPDYGFEQLCCKTFVICCSAREKQCSLSTILEVTATFGYDSRSVQYWSHSRVQNKVKKFGRPVVRTKSILIGHFLKMVRQKKVRTKKVFSFLVALICICITLHEYFYCHNNEGQPPFHSRAVAQAKYCSSFQLTHMPRGNHAQVDR